MKGSIAAAKAKVPSESPIKSDRLEALDGLRGVAALLVVFYHFTARWTFQENGESLYPYADGLLEALPFLNVLGLLGVSLFFLISGFVIFMTLERSEGIADFAVRRACRLWPTMIVCATLTTLLISISGIHLRFESISHWEVQPLEYLSSIVFIDPAFTGGLLNVAGLTWVDGVYWTLWIEVRFYALIALVYLLSSGGRHFVWVWLLIQMVSVLMLAMSELTNRDPHWSLNLIFQPYYLSWFTLGICGFLYWKRRVSAPVIAMGLLSLAGILSGSLSSSMHMENVAGGSHLLTSCLVIFVFGLFLVRAPAIKIFESTWAVRLGVASYPLYMFHERVGIIGMTTLDDLGVAPIAILPVMFVGVIGVSVLLHRYMEKPSKDLLLSLGVPGAKRLEKYWPALAFRKAAAIRFGKDE